MRVTKVLAIQVETDDGTRVIVRRDENGVAGAFTMQPQNTEQVAAAVAFFEAVENGERQ